jgi:hypothetical protein
MSTKDEKKRDEVLKRLLETPPKPHSPKKDKGQRAGKDKRDDGKK